MSSRQLRKLRQQQELLTPASGTESADQESEGDEPSPPKPRANVFSGFAALGDMDDDEDDDAAEEGEDEEEKEVANKSKPPTSQPDTSSSKKSKKKKKKGKKAQNARKMAEEKPSSETVDEVDEVDEIDRALSELNMKSSTGGTGGHSATETGPYCSQLASLLRINVTHLKVINEMRSVFGREAIEAARAEDQPPAPSPGTRRQPRQQQVDLESFLRSPPGQAGGRKMPEALTRRNPFIEWKDTWPRASAGGLTMQGLGDQKDPYEFTFAHDKTYVAMEAAFFSFVQTYQSEQMIVFLKARPYHVSSLIQVSKIAKQDQNSALAADLCERALFTFGRVTLSSFRKKLEEGKARMDFNRPENRQFWLAGYFYIKSLISKGTYRTALEWTKLFLSLSPDDEYAFLTYTHALAIRAHEAQWLIDFCHALDLHHHKPSPMREYFRQSVILAQLQLNDREGAKASLEKGIQTLPWLYGALFSMLNLDTPKSIWGVQPRESAEELYTQLYLQTTKDLWNNTQATALLQEVAGTAPKPDMKALPPADKVSWSIARFVYLDNTPALMALVPPYMLHASPNFDFDPLPPPKDENVFSNEVQQLPWDTSREVPPPRQIFREELGMDSETDDSLSDIEDNTGGQNQGLFRRFMNMLVPRAAAAGEAPGAHDSEGGEDSNDLPPPEPTE